MFTKSMASSVAFSVGAQWYDLTGAAQRRCNQLSDQRYKGTDGKWHGPTNADIIATLAAEGYTFTPMHAPSKMISVS